MCVFLKMSHIKLLVKKVCGGFRTILLEHLFLQKKSSFSVIIMSGVNKLPKCVKNYSFKGTFLTFFTYFISNFVANIYLGPPSLHLFYIKIQIF